MSPETIIAIGGGVIVVATLAAILAKKIPKRIKKNHYLVKWREIQKMCANKEDWGHAVIHSDMLLDEILIKKKITGKTMGERLVESQNKFSSNDSLWDAHKLANNIRQNAELKMDETKVKKTLVAYRQALRDLGALK